MSKLSQFGTDLLPATVWSWSKLDKYQTCPKRFAAMDVYKTHAEAKDKRSDALEYGDQVHKELDAYIRMRRPVSPGQTYMAGVVDKLVAGAVAVMPEMKLGVTRDLRLTGFFDDNVALRMVIDLFIERPDRTGIVIDWKTGQPRDKELQLKLEALGGFILRPHLQKIYCRFIYNGYPPGKVELTRDEIPGLVDEIGPQVGGLVAAIRDEHFPARQCWACRFCPVRECSFNRAK